MQTCETIIGKFLFALLLSSNVIFIAAEEEEDPQVKYSDYDVLGGVLKFVEDDFPRNAVPETYNITLTIHKLPWMPELLFIKGYSIITFRVDVPITELKFHYDERLIARGVEMVGETDEQEYEAGIFIRDITTFDRVKHIKRVQFSEAMLAGKLYLLHLKYSSIVPIELWRFEVESIIDEYHGIDWFMTTDHPPYVSRMIFPCWDMFGISTSFNLCVEFNNEYTVYSNTETLEIIDSKYGYSTTCFKPTKSMFVHQLAIAIIPKDIYLYSISNVGALRHRRVVNKQLTVMLEVIRSVVHIYSSFMDLKNLKTDFILIPNLPKEGIEKWGLIVYRETAVIYDKDIDPMAHKVEIKRLIARTFVNAWLSYAIKPTWWSQLWLQQGLSVYFATKITSKHLFIVQTRHESLQMDIKWNMRNLDTSSLKTIFFAPFSLHVKAPVILYMLENIVTPEVFRAGIKRYLKEYYLGSATPDHLWSQMQSALQDSEYTDEHPNITIKTVMDSWIKQQNYPIVTVERNEDDEILVCLHSNYSRSFSVERTLWVPITFTTQYHFDFLDTAPYAWLTPDKSCISLEPIRKNDWIIVNLQQTGYYRVKYEQWNWNLIAKYLNSKKYEHINVLNRAQIIDDAYYFMMIGELDCDMFYSIMKYLSQELNFKAWYPMLKIFEYVSPYLPYSESAYLKDQMLSIINDVLERITYEESNSDDMFIIFLRQELAKWACILNDHNCKKKANIKLVEHLRTSNPIRPGWKEWIVCNGLKTASRITWLKLFNTYTESLESIDKVLRILSCSGGVTSSNFQYDMQLSNDQETNCINILYYVVPTYEHHSLDTTLANLKDHILYCTFDPQNMVKVLTVIINRLHFEYQFSKIMTFVTRNMEEISDTIQDTIEIRRTYVKRYGKMFSVLSKGKTRSKDYFDHLQ